LKGLLIAFTISAMLMPSAIRACRAIARNWQARQVQENRLRIWLKVHANDGHSDLADRRQAAISENPISD